MLIDRLNFIDDYTKNRNIIEFNTVESEETVELFKNLKIIEKKIKELNSIELEELFITLKRVKIIFSTLDNFSNKLNSYFHDDDWQSIVEFFNRLVEIEYSMKEISKETYEIIQSIKNNLIENPLRNKVIELTEHYNNESLALCANYIDRDFSEEYSSLNYYKPNQIVKQFKLFDCVIFVGSPSIFKSFNTFFLGKKIIYVSYSFYKNNIPKIDYITNNTKNANQIYKDVFINKVKETHGAFTETNVTDLEKFELNKWITDYNKSQNLNRNISELVEGKIIQLENKNHIIMSPHSTIRKIEETITNNQDTILKMTSIDIGSLLAGDWVIIKLNTEEDYLIKKSKELYGAEYYNEQMELVRRYKEDLLNRRREYNSSKSFVQCLNNNNVKVASEAVLNNWITETIRPRNLEEILKYLEYDNELIIKTISAADFINSSHNAAGRELIKNIQNYLKLINPKQLEAAMSIEKEYDFKIKNIGLFKIQIVKSVVDDSLRVQPGEMYKIINTKEENLNE